MRIIILVLLGTMLLAVPVAAAPPTVRLNAIEVLVGDSSQGVEDLSAFQQTNPGRSTMLRYSNEKKIYPIADETFRVIVRLSNYLKEEFYINPRGYITDEDWLVRDGLLTIGLPGGTCAGEDQADQGGCQPFNVVELEPRQGRDFELVLSLTEAIEAGKTDIEIGLRTYDQDNQETVLWTKPLRMDFARKPVREFKRRLQEIRDWQNAQMDMRQHKRSGVINRYYVNGKMRAEKSYADGKLNGLTKFFCENGIMKEQLHYVDDRQDGETRSYECNKELRKVTIYRQGEVLGYTEFSPFESARDKKKKIERLKQKIENEAVEFPVVVF